MRAISIVVVAAVIGVLGGVGTTIATLKPKLNEAERSRMQLEGELVKLKQELPTREATIAQLETQRDALTAQLKAFQSAPPKSDTGAVDAAIVEEEAPEEELALPAPESPLEVAGNTENRRGGWDRGQRDEDLTPEERAEREQRRAEGFERARDRISDVMNQELAKATDRASQERIAAIEEQGQTMMDLMQQMREAQTDEEREEVRAAMDASREAMTGLMKDQQNAMLSDVARQYGITNPDKVSQFVNSIQETTSSTFFRAPMFMGGGFGGGGGPGGGGGFGGGRGGR